MDRETLVGNPQNTAANQRVIQLVREIHDLLETASPAADAASGSDERVAVRLAELAREMRCQFHQEENHSSFRQLHQGSPRQRGFLALFQKEHSKLLASVDDLFRMSAVSACGASHRGDIEDGFHRFVATLADHELREGDFLENVLTDEVTS